MKEIRELRNFFTEYWQYLALKTTVKAGIFELIEQNNNTLNLLLKKGNFDREILVYLLEFLYEHGYIELKEKINLLPKAQILTENHPKSLKYSCILWAEEHLTAWQSLEQTLFTGKPYSFDNEKNNYFEYIALEPEKLKIYHKAMYEYARDDYELITKKIDFSSFYSIMDVGGGLGALLNQIRLVFPNKKLFLFERKEVINLITNPFFETIEGNFFNKIPSVVDAIILSRVIHDWDDSKAVQILKNCYHALPDKGSLFIIENLQAVKNQSLALLNLNMRIMTNGHERNLDEYIILAEKAGFYFLNKTKLNKLQRIIQFKKQ